MQDLSGPLASLAADSGVPDPTVRWRTAALMADIPGEEAETLLLGMLHDSDYRVRDRAVACGDGVAGVEHDLAAQCGGVVLAELRQRAVGHGDEDRVAECHRLRHCARAGLRA